MLKFFIFTIFLHVAFAAPQFVTFKDGKIGVNFGGYHASAGLGGLLTGNAAHGGLSASAGTPWGPRAAAGLGGGVDGRTSGVLYAGAEANPAVGASAVLGGSAGESGFGGSEAHANGHVASKTIGSGSSSVNIESSATSAPAAVSFDNRNSIQKIKPPKKYSLIKDEPKIASSTATSEIQPIESISNVVTQQTNGIDDNAAAATSTMAVTTVQHVAANAAAADTAAVGISTRFGAAEDSNQQTPIVADTNVLVIDNRERLRQRVRAHQAQQRRILRERLRLEREQHKLNAFKSVEVPTSNLPQTTTAAVSVRQAKQATSNTAKQQTYLESSVAVPKKQFVSTRAAVDVNVEKYPAPPPPPATSIHFNSDIVRHSLQIPIGILQSLQQSLSGLKRSSVDVNYNSSF